jgi:NhaP-type Na+/H+ or K+/H+ antiporter
MTTPATTRRCYEKFSEADRILQQFPGQPHQLLSREEWGIVRCVYFTRPIPLPPARYTFIVEWTGLRGLISLAAAIALPQTLSDDAPLAQNTMIVFLAFSVILVTLVVQGLTLPPLNPHTRSSPVPRPRDRSSPHEAQDGRSCVP